MLGTYDGTTREAEARVCLVSEVVATKSRVFSFNPVELAESRSAFGDEMTARAISAFTKLPPFNPLNNAVRSDRR